MSATVDKAKAHFAAAECATNLKAKSEQYHTAAKLYLVAVQAVEDDNIRRSLLYLSNMCSAKASFCVKIPELPRPEIENDSVALNLNSERAIHHAHLAKLHKADHVSTT